MGFKIFLDANILLDFILKREEYDKARDIIQIIRDGNAEGFVTPSIVHILGYWLTKAYDSEKAKELILLLLEEIKVIDIPHEITILALASKIDDIEDALQYYSAIHHNLDFFISRDKKLKKSSVVALPVYTPHEFLSDFS